ncbi:MAG: ABC transporter ATP-binding protein [Acetobacteraceae bacterium]|nr:ABC transporter ATP-binding protein [Acetobacteraceae bacterium]
MITLDNVTLTHDRHPAVHHLSGRFAPGSLTAIVGPNGAGKTTLLRALAGLHPVAAGRIQGAGTGRIALLPQSASLDRSFPIACLDIVAMGLWSACGPFRAIGPEGLARTEGALAAVGLKGFERRTVGTLSAGQFQRLLFARLAVQDAPVLLLDEPFNAVDARTEADLLALIESWHSGGRTVVLVSHDLDLVRERCPETLLLARHALAWGPTADVLQAGAMRQARLAAEAWTDTAPECRAAA